MKAGVAIFISNKVKIRAKKVTRDREELYIIRMSINQDDM